MSGVTLGYYYGLQFERGDIIQMDHSYARPFQSLVHHNKSLKAKPRRLLQVDNVDKPVEDDAVIDVVGGPDIIVPPIDYMRNNHLLNETERFLFAHCSSKLSDEQEEWMSRGTWTIEQNALFLRVMKIIDTARMARLSAQGHHNEWVMRHIYTSHAARQLRKTFAMIKWDKDLTGWLHNIFFSGLSLRLLAIYMDMLQYLQQSVPLLVNKLIENHKVANPARSALTSFETISAFLCRSTDPNLHLNSVKPSRIAGNPLMLIIPHYLDSDITESALNSRLSGLSNMTKIKMVSVVQSTDKIKTASQYSTNLVSSIRSAVSTERSKHESRNLFTLGWGVASLTSLHIASVEPISGAVCLGLPLNRKHKPLRNVIADIKCPVLFIVGTSSRSSSITDIENLLQNMPGDKRLIIIEDADDSLCIPMSKQVSCGITQLMLDQIIVDEIGDFLISIAGYAPPTREELQEFEEQEIARNRKRKLEATVRKYTPVISADELMLKRKATKRSVIEKKIEPIKKEKKKRKIKVRKSDSPFDYSVSDSERNDMESLSSLAPSETRKLSDVCNSSYDNKNTVPLEERYKTPDESPSNSPQSQYDPKAYTSYSKFKSSSTAESYMKTYHLSKIRTPNSQDGSYLVYPGSRGSSPTYHPAHTPNLTKGTPSIYQSSSGFQRWN